MGISFTSLRSGLATAACIAGIAYFVLSRKESSILYKSPINFDFLRKRDLTVVEDKKLGLTFSYCPTECVLYAETRAFPVAFFELKVLPEMDSSILLTVEEFKEPISLAEHKIFSYNAIAMHLSDVHIEREKSSTFLGGRSAVEFEYTYSSEDGTRRRCWCSLAVHDNRAYAVHCHARVQRFGHAMLVCRRVVSKMRIHSHSVPNSELIFTEPRFGLSMPIQPEYSLEYTSSEKKNAILKLSKQIDDGKGASIELEHISSLRPEVLDNRTLDIAITTTRGMVENAVKNEECLEWQTGTVLDDAALMYLKQSISVSSFEYSIVAAMSKLPGKFFFYDISTRSPVADTSKIRRYVVFVVLTTFGVFRLTACSEADNFVKTFVEAKETLQQAHFGFQHGQECSLLYRNTKAGFSMRIPPHFHVQETMVADPIVLIFDGSKSLNTDESQAAKFTIDVSSQMRSVGEQSSKVFDAYLEHLQDPSKFFSVTKNECLVDRFPAAEFQFCERVENSHVQMCVTLICIKEKQYSVQLTVQPGCFDDAYAQYKAILETFRFFE